MSYLSFISIHATIISKHHLSRGDSRFFIRSMAQRMPFDIFAKVMHMNKSIGLSIVVGVPYVYIGL